ncbi:hypothetical protein Taro_017043 [Colocasia esculenta]|uniref:Uncharacterized protein n=1 Tax=Colocasia esculenta TaxID=4460 RepID=A0A843UM40_COLES|nr:hypothetical protein [Colocasia esculenta]
MAAAWNNESDSDSESSSSEEEEEKANLAFMVNIDDKGRVEEFLAAGEAGDPHTKSFFFLVVSVATCTNHHLEVDQRWGSRRSPHQVVLLPRCVCCDLHRPSSCSQPKATSVDTTWASVDTLSQIGQKVFWELSLVSTPPDPVSTLLDQFFMFLLCVRSMVSTPFNV